MRRTIAVSSCALALCAAAVLSGQMPRNLDQRIARIEGHLVPTITIKDRPASAMAIAERMRFYNVPGVSVAVINGGAVEWARGYGVLEAGGSEPVTPHTRFQAASISKPIAAMAVLRIVEAGFLALDEDVNAKLRSWKVPENEFTKQEKVTLRRVLSHSAGLTVHGFAGYEAGGPMPTLVQVLDGVKPANSAPIRVDVVPGSLWRYSGGGYTVLQQMLIDMARRPFPVIVRDGVLGPIGMTDSSYDQPWPESLRGQAASGHTANGKVIPGRYHTYPELAAAGLWTTPTDLARFALAIQQAAAGKSELLSQATAKQMLTVQKGAYGLGLSLDGSGPIARFSHGGSNAGFQCLMVAYVETGQGAVVMTNGDRGAMLAQEIVRAIAAEYGWRDYPGTREKTVAQVDPTIYKAYVGRYEYAPGRVIGIRVEGNMLMATDGRPDERGVELLPESPSKFFQPVQALEFEFVRGPGGEVTHMIVNGSTKARRLPSS